MDFVKMPRGGRLGHEVPEASIQRAVVHQIRAGSLGEPLVVEWRPLAEDSRRIEIDVTVGNAVRVVGHFSFAFSLSEAQWQSLDRWLP
jgi:hypothetical protein